MNSLLKKLLGATLALLALCGLVALLFPERLADFALEAARKSAGLSPQEVDIPGYRIAYLSGGRGDPLVLLPSVGTDKDIWLHAAQLLTSRYTVYAIDLPGFGESSSPDNASYTLADQVANLGAILDALKLDHVDIGGNGAGGWIAGCYAAANRQRVLSLWLLDPLGVAGAQTSELQRRLKGGQSSPLFISTPDQFRDSLRFLFVRTPYIPGVVFQRMARRAAASYSHNVSMLAQIQNNAQPLEASLRGVAIPALVIWGARDRVVHPSGALSLKKAMPNAEVIIMPNIGHMPMLESPEPVAGDYLRFRDNLPPRTPGTPAS